MKYNQGENSMQVPLVSYTSTDSLPEKGDAYHNNHQQLKHKHTTCSYLLFTQCLFDSNKIKHDYYWGKECMKNFWKDFKEQVMKITNF